MWIPVPNGRLKINRQLCAQFKYGKNICVATHEFLQHKIVSWILCQYVDDRNNNFARSGRRVVSEFFPRRRKCR